LDAQQNDERSGGTRHGQANDLWMARHFLFWKAMHVILGKND
jgi:hypothetical protein